VSDHTVARRYARLRSAGTPPVRGLVDPARIDQTRWFVRAQIAALRPPPQDRSSKPVALDEEALYRYLTTDAAALPGIRHLATAPVIRTVQSTGVPA
jgi:hypothetical protein